MLDKSLTEMWSGHLYKATSEPAGLCRHSVRVVSGILAVTRLSQWGPRSVQLIHQFIQLRSRTLPLRSAKTLAFSLRPLFECPSSETPLPCCLDSFLTLLVTQRFSQVGGPCGYSFVSLDQEATWLEPHKTKAETSKESSEWWRV